MSSSSSSSSGTGAKSPSRLPQASRRAFTWSAATLTVAALYVLPSLVLRAVLGSLWAIAPIVACVAVLAYAAVRRWSPLIVLALLIVAALSFALWSVIALVDTCGHSDTASIVEWSGTVVIALALPVWQLERGRAIFWAIPVAAVLAGIWFVAAAHVIPGGADGCLE